MTTRKAIVDEAKTWLGTPWHHEARVKGAGVDCAQLLIAVYSACGLIDDFSPEHYPPDWHLHRELPRFMNGILDYATVVNDPLPGDIAMFQYGRHAAHGSIVTEWPVIIHAWKDEGMVTLSDLSINPGLSARLSGFYSLRGLER